MRLRIAGTLLLIASISFGMMYTSKAAYAHTFGSDESASFLAKVQEVQAEAHFIQADAGNATLLSWHLDKIGQYWTSSDTSQVAERNQLLSNEIPSTISNLTNEAIKANPNSATIKQFIDKLDGYMSESVTTRIDQPKLQNLTVSALAVKLVLDEVMNDYGNATGSSASSMNMSSSSSSGSMSMSGSMSSSNNSTS